ncbi:magnesium chelatase [Streptomyces dengpaensis]|uniref:Magnesium chelatase n=2 Tax=Streptomyces TaxID=1883 RepID=A0ABM6T237_9ACTN|nr:magnesium chelatase [Streptomyces dengpaensis]PIB07061.1 magnesium chelatase [Streptomyces sp. HG99]
MLPYSLIVGQEELRTALEIAYVSPGVGGVLATGQRGTAKTTTVRAFTTMAVSEFPVTLPIGATDDRVLGGWEIPELMHGKSTRAEGLLERAARSASRMLYVDEINLLDDYLVNIILDVASTGVLPLERDHHSEDLRNVEFTLVGTMNPDEGGLRPQLLDRFGLVATVESEATDEQRQRIVETVLRFEAEREAPASEFIAEALRRDGERKATLDTARERVATVRYDTDVVARCARLAQDFALAGHRGELVLMRAARALAAIEGAERVSRDHVRRVAKPALVHRRGRGDTGTFAAWTDQDDERVRAVLDDRTD